MQPVTVKCGPIKPAVQDGIYSGAVAQAGPLTLNGPWVVDGVAIIEDERRIAIYSTGDASAVEFTIYGANATGNTITEVIKGPNNGVSNSVLDYDYVTKIVASAPTSAVVKIGTNSIAGSPWVRLDPWATGQVAIQVNVYGNVNYTLQQTLDDPNSATNPVAPADVTWVNSGDQSMVNSTKTGQSNYFVPPVFCRVVLNSGSGYLTATFNQAGVVNI